MLQSKGWGETSTWVRAGVIAWSFLGMLIIGAGVIWLLARLWVAVFPLVVGGIIVFLLKTPVAWMVDRGLSRALATTIAFVALLAALAGFGFFIFPELGRRFVQFANAFPGFYEEARAFVQELQDNYQGAQMPAWVISAFQAAQDSIASSLAQASRSLATGILSAGTSILGFFTSLFLGMIIGFYLLAGLPAVGQGMLRMFPPDTRGEVTDIGMRMNAVVGGFIRGQALIALIVGVVTGVAMALIGVPYAVTIGVIAGVTNIIPYVGPIVGGFVAAIVALFVDPVLMLWAIAVFVAIQQLESTFLSPKIMSDQVGLHPVVVILSLAAGASLAGLIGMLLAVPVAGTVSAVWSHYSEKHGWSVPEEPSVDEPVIDEDETVSE